MIRALFGGAFDPPHFGHQMIVHYLLESAVVDRVHLVLCAHHPDGKALSEWEQRWTWCNALIEPFGDAATVDPIERELGGLSTSFRTAEALREKYPEDTLRWVTGSDADIDQWVNPERLRLAAPPLMIGRGERDPGDLPLVMPEVSSTEVRARRAAGQSLRGLVPARVAALLGDDTR
jgi:nicotinate-nucleotide adenylyltransferase